MKRFEPWEIIIALDRLLNAILAGDSRICFSTRIYYARLKGKRWAKICGWIVDGIAYTVFRQKDHCKASAEYDASFLK